MYPNLFRFDTKLRVLCGLSEAGESQKHNKVGLVIENKTMKSDHTTATQLESSEKEPQSQGQAFSDLIRGSASGETGQSSSAPTIQGVVIGTLIGFQDSGGPLVDFPANTSGKPLPARTTATLPKDAIGREVALLFEGGDPNKPLVVGLIEHPEIPSSEVPENVEDKPGAPVEIVQDGERVVFNAEKEIVLRCGKASITLTSAGKILLRGAYLLNRSSGVNRIKGGSVQIN